MEINELIKKAHENAENKGFYEGKPEISSLLMLIVTEISEACEADRKNYHTNKNDLDHFLMDSVSRLNYEFFVDKIKDTFEDELADAIIRICDLAGYCNIDLDKHIQAKMLYNKGRPYKHGKLY
jgi:NTP pyrophosphatase (non-canonical NTP hydrolase)